MGRDNISTTFEGKCPVCLEGTVRFTRDIVLEPKLATIRARRILREVAEDYAVEVADVVSDSRVQRVADARHEAEYRMRYELGLTYQAIGIQVGGKDHSSVIHGVKKVEALRAV